MYSLTEQSKRWDKVYQTKNGVLPWSGISFSEGVDRYLDSINKDDLLLIAGCGIGETVDRLNKKGFHKIVGTDISEEAINQARDLFPDLDFKIEPTEDLKNNTDLLDSNVLDWLNFHQISPDAITPYLSSMAAIAKTICISWIYHEGEEKNRSYVHEGEVYFHNPNMVANVLSSVGFSLKEQSGFIFNSNGLEKNTVHNAITQIYAKS
jgi:hypothetical protein